MKFNKLNQRYYLMNHITHPLYSCGHPINTHNIPVANSWPPVRNSWPPSDSAILNEIFPFKSIGHVALSLITCPLVSFREKLLFDGHASNNTLYNYDGVEYLSGPGTEKSDFREQPKWQIFIFFFLTSIRFIIKINISSELI